MKLLAPSVLVILLFVLQSCGAGESTQAEDPSLGMMDSHIFNGDEAPTLYPELTESERLSIVYVGIANEKACSGALITPHVVLTAAHCFFNDQGERYYSAEVSFGTDAYKPLYRTTVEEIFVHPDYDYAVEGVEGSEYDIAILYLSSTLGTATPLLLNFQIPGELIDQSVQVVGYGRTETGSSAYKYWGVMKATEFTLDGLIYLEEQITDHHIFSGDSGSPLLFDFGDGPSIAGVASAMQYNPFSSTFYLGVYTCLYPATTFINYHMENGEDTGCPDICTLYQCGEIYGCDCGDCAVWQTCEDNLCVGQPPTPGLGHCISFPESGVECFGYDDCAEGSACLRYGDNYDISECAPPCEHEPCSPNDSESYCYNAGEGDGFCIEAQFSECETEEDSCVTSDGRAGLCVLFDEDEQLDCLGLCHPDSDCPSMSTCIPAVSTGEEACAQWCNNNQVECNGQVVGCDCGSCDSGEVCDTFKCRPYGMCGYLQSTGCCEGSYSYACKDGKPKQTECGDASCGWSPDFGYSCWFEGLSTFYDNTCPEPDCEAYCQAVDCGSFIGCDCGGCDQDYECRNNTCEALITDGDMDAAIDGDEESLPDGDLTETEIDYPCVEAGGTIEQNETHLQCCEGLSTISCKVPDQDGICPYICHGSVFCADCGDGTCGPGENHCNCIEDCSAPVDGDTDAFEDDSISADGDSTEMEMEWPEEESEIESVEQDIFEIGDSDSDNTEQDEIEEDFPVVLDGDLDEDKPDDDIQEKENGDTNPVDGDQPQDGDVSNEDGDTSSVDGDVSEEDGDASSVDGDDNSGGSGDGSGCQMTTKPDLNLWLIISVFIGLMVIRRKTGRLI